MVTFPGRGYADCTSYVTTILVQGSCNRGKCFSGLTTPGLDTPKPLPLKGRQPTVPLGLQPVWASPDLPKSSKALYTRYSKSAQ